MNEIKNRFPDNSDRAVNERRYRSTLMIIGRGIIVFAVWTLFKTLSTVFMNRTEWIGFIRDNVDLKDVIISDELLFGMMLALAVLYLLFGVSSRLIIGISAINEANGIRKGRIYLPLSVIITVINSIELLLNLKNLFKISEDELAMSNTSVAALIIQLTSMILLIELSVTAIKLRRLERQDRKEGD